MSVLLMTEIQIPKAFKPLFEPKRFKTYYGGRGGAKSHNFARALLVMGMDRPLRVLCARELQNSITDSVHRLLADIIRSHDLEDFYQIQKANILGLNGTEFIFKGLKHNATEIKSTEGVDICWVEEAEKVSDNSWELLIPTIRKEGSEIWISFNPKLPSDPTYQRFVEKADGDMLVRKVSYKDNPFLPDTLRKEAERLKRTDPQAYEHIWEGNFDKRFFGGIYATQIEAAREAERVGVVPYKPGVPVIAAWDLGNANATAIWFCQRVGLQPRVIHFYENSNEDLPHYAEYIRKLPYSPKNYLPHDAAHERLGMSGSIMSQLEEMGLECELLKINSVEAGIEQARSFIGQAWFDTSTQDGLHALSHYQYEWDENRQRFKDKPLKDWSSDAADAFRYLAQAYELEDFTTQKEQEYIPPPSGSWMG